jgi:ATP-binding cassette subfamily B multidrug efflux pump
VTPTPHTHIQRSTSKLDPARQEPLSITQLLDGSASPWACALALFKSTPGFGWKIAIMLLVFTLMKSATSVSALLLAVAIDPKLDAIPLWLLSIGSIAALFFAVKLVEAVLEPIAKTIAQWAEGYAESRVLDGAFHVLLGLPMASWQGADASEVAARLDVRSQIKHFCYCLFRWSIPSFIEMILACFALARLGTLPVFFVLLATLCVYWFFGGKIMPMLERNALATSKSQGKMTKITALLLQNVELGRSYEAYDVFSKERARAARMDLDARCDQAQALNLGELAPNACLAVGLGIIFFFCLSLLGEQQISQGAFAATLALCFSIITTTRSLSFAFFGIMDSAAAMSFAVLLLNAQPPQRSGIVAPEPTDSTQPTEPTADHARQLSLRDITVQPAGCPKPILDHLSLTLGHGDKVWLVGRSGAGKSTLFKTLCGFIPLLEGSMQWHGMPIQEGGLRHVFAWMPQEADTMSGSVRLNLALGNPSATDEHMWAAIDQAGICSKIIQAGGLDSKINPGASNWSGGQRARLALARAFVSGFPVLLLDEPSAALDLNTEHVLFETIQAKKDSTAIISVHRIRAIPAGARVVVLDHGRIVQDATREKLMATPGLFSELWTASDQRDATD